MKKRRWDNKRRHTVQRKRNSVFSYERANRMRRYRNEENKLLSFCVVRQHKTSMKRKHISNCAHASVSDYCVMLPIIIAEWATLGASFYSHSVYSSFKCGTWVALCIFTQTDSIQRFYAYFFPPSVDCLIPVPISIYRKCNLFVLFGWV